MATNTQLESLRQALSFDRPPLCSGAISPPPEGLCLYYGKRNPRFVDFASATPEELDLLLAACQPATFGRGNEDVYDESYRKAFKMDASDFNVQLDLMGTGLVRTIEDQLLHRETENKCIRAELYKLNVYEKGSFFKAHKDTPRSTDMLGSLVIVYPTPHEGGELVLRHKDHEWKFDANALTVSQPSPSLAYIAFYSDIEHEVLKVTDGRRVTITYNLYLVDQLLKPRDTAVTENARSVSNLETTLKGLLKSPEFLPDGGTLGFGLAHLYPVTPDMNLREMKGRLKGEDAHVYRACRELQLRPSLRMIYDDDESGLERGIMVDRIAKNLSYDFYSESYQQGLVARMNGVSVNKTEGINPDKTQWIVYEKGKAQFITWISPLNERNKLQELAIAYGNEVSSEFIYCSPCIIARVAAATNRA